MTAAGAALEALGPPEGGDPGAPGLVGSEVAVLRAVVAWLQITAIKTEQVQWNMLQIQSLANVYRKAAFRTVLDARPLFADGDARSRHRSRRRPATCPSHGEALAVFDEVIDFTVDQRVPDPTPFSEKLEGLFDAHARFVVDPEGQKVCETVLRETRSLTSTAGCWKPRDGAGARAGARAGEGAGAAARPGD